MPRYHHTESQNVEESSLEEEKVIKKNSKLLLFLGFTYFALSCGLEGFFQSQTYTFGICGPHKISPEKVAHLVKVSVIIFAFEAASLTSVYFGTFLAGRFVFSASICFTTFSSDFLEFYCPRASSL